MKNQLCLSVAMGLSFSFAFARIHCGLPQGGNTRRPAVAQRVKAGGFGGIPHHTPPLAAESFINLIG